jgi:hypothetical protein
MKFIIVFFFILLFLAGFVHFEGVIKVLIMANSNYWLFLPTITAFGIILRVLIAEIIKTLIIPLFRGRFFAHKRKENKIDELQSTVIVDLLKRVDNLEDTVYKIKE